MIEFLIFGGFWFWLFFVFLSAFAILNIIFSENEFKVWWVGIFLIALFLFSGIVNFAWIIANPLTILIWVGIYIGCGIVWSIKEWYSFTSDRLADISSGLSRSDLTFDELKHELSHSVDIKNYWPEVTTWIVYFPFFILAWVLTNPIKKIAKQFSFIYNGISKAMVNKQISKIQKNRITNGPKN